MKLFSDEKLSPEAQKLVLEVAKQLITLSVAAIGFVTSMLFTTFKGTSYVLSAQISLFNFLLCASTGVLVQLAVVNESLQDETWFKVSYPRVLLFLSWALFVGGLVSFVVFTLANLKNPQESARQKRRNVSSPVEFEALFADADKLPTAACTTMAKF